MLQKLSLNIKDPQNTTIEINHVSRALTDKILQNKRNTDNITARIDRVERGYVNNGNITDIANEIIENSSAFEQNSKAIMAQVSELYTKITDFETYKKSVSTQFTQTDNSFNYQFNNLTEVINNLDADSAAQFNNIIKYIRFADGDIILGEVNNNLMLKISNDKISFLQNGIEVAYMTDNKLYITDGEFLNSLQLGNFSFYPRSKGMAIGKVSTQSALEINMDTKLTGSFTINGKTIFDLIYPVGSIYLSIKNINPGNLFGGTWVGWGQGRVPVGVASSGTFNYSEKTGGSETHTLTTSQMPSHEGHIPGSSYCWGNAGEDIYFANLYSNAFSQYGRDRPWVLRAGNEVCLRSNYIGGGNAHNNLQPYITCYMWKRTA